MKDLILYVHGRFGSAGESRHYEGLFPGCEVVGLDYSGSYPWEVGPGIRRAVEKRGLPHRSVSIAANSIGAYYCLHAGVDGLIKKAFFISPIVDMEGLITGLMERHGVSEEELERRGSITLPGGETLSHRYLRFVREHPISWNVPTHILYGGRDEMTPRKAIEAFAAAHGAELTIYPEGQHWFHTPEQMRFLDEWIIKSAGGQASAAGKGADNEDSRL